MAFNFILESALQEQREIAEAKGNAAELKYFFKVVN